MQRVLWLIWANRKSALAVTMINIPLSLALAIASGATPLQGLLTAFWAWLLAAIFCSSHHNIYGPAGSLAGILLPIAITYGIAYLPILAIWGWLIILLIAVLRLSKYIVLIPTSALQWFLLGIGLIIGLQQIPAALGMDLGYTITQVFANLWEINSIAIWIFIISMIVLQLFKKFLPSVPWAIVVTVLGALLGKFFIRAGSSILPLLIDVYTEVKFSLFQIPDFWMVTGLFSDTVALKAVLIASVWVAVIAVLETLISSRMAYKETRVAFDAQREVYGLWITNLLSGLVWSLPSSALVPRTTMNMTSGATHRMSGGLVSIITAVIALFLFEWRLAYLPFAVTAAILIDVAMGMINLSLYHKMRKLEKQSILIILFVWVLSYLWDPMMGILVGAVMALLTVVKRSMEADLMVNVFRWWRHAKKLTLSDYESFQQVWDVIIVKLEWELNYLTTESHISAMQSVADAETIILWFGHTASLDIDAMEEFALQIQQRLADDKNVYLTGLHGHTLHMMEQSGVFGHLEANGYVYESKSELLDKIL